MLSGITRPQDENNLGKLHLSPLPREEARTDEFIRLDNEDRLELSPEAREYLDNREKEESRSLGGTGEKADKIVTGKQAADEKPGSGKQVGNEEAAKKNKQSELSEDEKRLVDDLKKTDQRVRTHEQAHMSAGGGYAGAAQYQYAAGPDGKQYAVGGEVSIDTSPIPDNPQATVAKMQTVRGAALAPADPSGADRAVAAAASKMEADARRQLTEKMSGDKADDVSVPGEKSKPEDASVPGEKSKPDAVSASGEKSSIGHQAKLRAQTVNFRA